MPDAPTIRVSEWEIRVDDLRGDAIVQLLREHPGHMLALTPRHSAHALDVERLRGPKITFCSVGEGAELPGCGASKELDPRTGAIESMRTAEGRRAGMVAHGQGT